MSRYHYLKDSPVGGIVVTFTAQQESHGILIIKFRQTSRLSNRQQLNAKPNLLKIVGVFMARAESNACLGIFARSCFKAMGAGGTTPNRERPRLISGSAGASSFLLTELLMVLSILIASYS